MSQCEKCGYDAESKHQIVSQAVIVVTEYCDKRIHVQSFGFTGKPRKAKSESEEICDAMVRLFAAIREGAIREAEKEADAR